MALAPFAVAGKKAGMKMARDLQAWQDLAHEYRVFTHGNAYDQRKGMRIASDADEERAITGGFDVRRGNLCPCGIARSRNGAAACGAEH
jgi:hypothetical protein